jgi:ABC-2 type transport system permease protein
MNAYLRIWKKAFQLKLAEDMAYKWNFLVKCIALMFVDLLGPISAILIYMNSSGIPGWSFQEFILFSGSFVLVTGLSHFFFIQMPVNAIEQVRKGTFDATLTKPFRPLLYLTLMGWDMDGISEIIVGIGLIAWSAAQIGGFGALNILFFIILVLFGVLFQYAIMIIITALSFLFVKSFSLFEIFFGLQKFARYPINIFSTGLRYTITFLIPIAITAHYPVSVLLGRFGMLGIYKILLPIVGFFVVSLLIWEWAMKQYTSAGG